MNGAQPRNHRVAMALCSAASVLVNTSVTGQILSWQEWTHPGWRTSHAAAFDKSRGRYVVFGGQPLLGPAAETYEWDGERWLRAAIEGPDPREGHAMVYDSLRAETVLFGGIQSLVVGFPTYFSDTWVWDGQAWTFLTDIGPHPRERQAMAFDPDRAKIVLFGGHFVDPENWIAFDDTWEWDGTSWTELAVAGPSARFNAKMVYDAARQRTVLFGGMDGSNVFADTWEWDGSSWTLAATSGPPCRTFHSMTYDSDRQKVVLFGGTSPCINFPFMADQQDTWEWDGTSWTQAANGGPFKRRFAAMSYDATSQRSLLYGGVPAQYFPVGNGGSPLESDLPLGDLWEWDGQTWAQRVTTIPRGRYAHRMAHDAARGVTVLFGGRTSVFGYETETWEWDGAGWTRKQYSDPLVISPEFPRRRGLHGMAYDSLRQRVWLFGGALGNAGPGFNDTWWWNGSEWTEHVPANRPPARYWHDMAYDAARDRLVVFGGFETELFGDTWEFDGEDWSLMSTTGPSPRIEYGIAYDAARQRVVLFGGTNSIVATDPGAPFGDTWAWDGATWTRMSQTGPTPRYSMASAYDSHRERVVIRGGLTHVGGEYVRLDDTWEWDGSEWTLIPSDGPGARHSEAMVYEPSREQMLMFGGAAPLEAGEFTQPGFLGETWMLKTVVPGDLDGDRDVDITDLGILLAEFGCPNAVNPGHCAGDADADGDTDIADLGVVLAWLGR